MTCSVNKYKDLRSITSQIRLFRTEEDPVIQLLPLEYGEPIRSPAGLYSRDTIPPNRVRLLDPEKRALKVTEAILANLNRYRGLLNGDEIPRTTEIILSFDDPLDDFREKVRQLGRELEQSGLRNIGN